MQTSAAFLFAVEPRLGVLDLIGQPDLKVQLGPSVFGVGEDQTDLLFGLDPIAFLHIDLHEVVVDSEIISVPDEHGLVAIWDPYHPTHFTVKYRPRRAPLFTGNVDAVVVDNDVLGYGMRMLSK